jgi:tetratricopeptide (TPR) repeat protein
VRSLRTVLDSLPSPLRWTILGAAGLLLVVLVASATWALWQHRQARAASALAEVAIAYREAVASKDTATLKTAADALRQFLADYPRSAGAAQGWYYLANLEYQRGDFDAAHAAYQEASRRDSGSVRALSRVGLGYALEAKGDLERALAAYRAALEGRDAKDFLYAEVLVAIGRVEVALKRPAAAVEAYRRVLKEVPGFPRAEEVRIQLAALGAKP